jgi:hypothetical protein
VFIEKCRLSVFSSLSSSFASYLRGLFIIAHGLGLAVAEVHAGLGQMTRDFNQAVEAFVSRQNIQLVLRAGRAKGRCGSFPKVKALIVSLSVRSEVAQQFGINCFCEPPRLPGWA